VEFSAELLDSLASSVLPTGEAETLPPELYTDEAFFEFERNGLFAHEWLCIGRADQVPHTGDYVAFDLLAEPLILVRGRDGALRVLSAVCQHRAMVVAEGTGCVNSFRCPYHHWNYGLDGRLLGAPAMQDQVGFDRHDVRLPSVKVEEWRGFVFVNFDPLAPPLAPTLSKIEQYLDHFPLESMVGRATTDRFPAMPWNWKVMLENFNDGYHASRLHGGVHDFCPSEMAEFTGFDSGDNAIVRTNGFTVLDGGFNALQRAILPLIPGLSELERSRVVFALIPPTFGIGLAPDQVFYFLIHPLSAATTDIEVGYLFDPGAVRHPLFEELFQLSSVGISNIIAQDVHATTMVQKGLRSRFAPRGRYSSQEEIQRQLNVWLVDRYRASWPDLPAESSVSPIELLGEGRDAATG
jgi:phenylpropionate dioxygenase-like ring-hydroxylating dioxygenase large terminal subunit